MPIRYNGQDNRLVYGNVPVKSVMLGGGPCIYGDEIGYSTIFIYSEKSDGNISIDGLTEKGKTLVQITIPQEIGGKSVVSISDEAFLDNQVMQVVTIPTTITHIGLSAFEGCSYLTQINWNAISVDDFTGNDYAFNNAGKLGGGITVTFGDSVQTIPAYMFVATSPSNSPQVNNVIISNSVTSIGARAFLGCRSLTSVTIGNSVTSIGTRAFAGCMGLTTVHWNAISVGNLTSSSQLFYNAGTSGEGIIVTFSDEVQTIPAYLFYVSSSSYRPNISTINIGINLQSIGDNAFCGCTNLIAINWNATSVNDLTSSSNIFEDSGTTQQGITVVFADNVQTIPAYAFYNCLGVSSITIGKNVTNIGQYAFYNSLMLTQINWNAISVNDFVRSSQVFYSAGIRKTGISLIFGDDVEKIPAYLFCASNYSLCPNIKSVTIGNGVTNIGERAFEGCIGLTSITIPDGVASIGDSAFHGCYTLVEVYNKSELNIVLGDSGNGYVGYYAKNIYINEGESKISLDSNGFIFYYDDAIGYLVGYVGSARTVVFPNNFITYNGTTINSYEIYKYSFYNNQYITSITLPNSITNIGVAAFQGCTYLTSINWNIVTMNDFELLSGIFRSAGTDASGITVVFGGNVQTIPAYLFVSAQANQFPNITRTTIGSSVTSIGYRTFYGCDNLTSASFRDKEGWQVSRDSTFSDYTSLSSSQLSLASAAATYLNSMYTNYYWRKV